MPNPPPAVKAAHQYTREEMRELLRVGAALDGRPTIAAAVHLLSFTQLPGRKDFAKYVSVDLEQVQAGADTHVPAAFLGSWPRLGRGLDMARLTGGEQRFLAIAEEIATGRFGEQLGGLGTVHARRVVEATAIAARVELDGPTQARIWCNGRGRWWCGSETGYTAVFEWAGLYPIDVARKLVDHTNRFNPPVRAEDSNGRYPDREVPHTVLVPLPEATE